LVVIGDCCADVVVSSPNRDVVFGDQETLVDTATVTIGGSSTITACGAATLGVSTALVTRVGSDPLGRLLLETVAQRGVNLEHAIVDDSVPTGMSVVIVRDADRAILTALGTIERLTAADVPTKVLDFVKHVHVGSYFLQHGLRPDLGSLFARSRSAGATTSLDTNWDPAQRWEGVDELLSQTDILFLNEVEVIQLASRRVHGRLFDGASTDRAAQALTALNTFADSGVTVVVKAGPSGATAIRDQEIVHVPAARTSVIDTIGAGDSFAAGFLRAHLAGASLTDALALACACGSLSTRGHGGTAAQPDLASASAVAADLRTRARQIASRPA
jgi:sugar/nucleoside kinase (ribokinase family)